jgi:AcrR family transcriptional regulator
MAVPRSEQKERTRRALIDAALELSAKRGFAGLSLREIAKAAGVTPAAFYRHFYDLDELGLVLVDEVGLILRRLMREARHQAASGRGVVRSSVRTYMHFLQEKPNLFRLLLGERSASSPSFRKAMHAEISRFVGELAEDLRRGRRLYDPHLAAEAIVAVVFTVGAEALDLPQTGRKKLALRLEKEILMIYRGALRRPSSDLRRRDLAPA